MFLPESIGCHSCHRFKNNYTVDGRRNKLTADMEIHKQTANEITMFTVNAFPSFPRPSACLTSFSARYAPFWKLQRYRRGRKKSIHHALELFLRRIRNNPINQSSLPVQLRPVVETRRNPTLLVNIALRSGAVSLFWPAFSFLFAFFLAALTTPAQLEDLPVYPMHRGCRWCLSSSAPRLPSPPPTPHVSSIRRSLFAFAKTRAHSATMGTKQREELDFGGFNCHRADLLIPKCQSRASGLRKNYEGMQ